MLTLRLNEIIDSLCLRMDEKMKQTNNVTTISKTALKKQDSQVSAVPGRVQGNCEGREKLLVAIWS